MRIVVRRAKFAARTRRGDENALELRRKECMFDWKGAKRLKEKERNEEIRARRVVVIDENGARLGEMPTREAIRTAYERGFDLVLVSPNENPPVCRIADYGKMTYEAARKERAGKKRKPAETKELRLRPGIAEHDAETKARAAEKFLKAGNRVKLTCRFRGREAANPNLGYEVLERFAERLSECGTTSGKAVKEGRSAFLTVFPIQKN